MAEAAPFFFFLKHSDFFVLSNINQETSVYSKEMKMSENSNLRNEHTLECMTELFLNN